MGERGRAARPAALKLLEGGPRARTGKQNKPASDVVRPGSGETVCPDLPPAARAVWDRLAPDLIAKGVLTHWDVDSFARYCVVLTSVWEAQRHLDEEGPVDTIPILTKDGEHIGDRRQKSPWMNVWQAASDKADRLAARFGLTPSDRNAITISNASPKDADADYLSG